MPTVHEEVEIKYVAADDFEVPALTELLATSENDPGAAGDGSGPVVEGEVVRQRLKATYFDTADLRLGAAGLTLRRRTGGDDAGWHLKVPTASSTRSEVRLPLGRSRSAVPKELQQMVWARSAGEPLVPVATIDTSRTVRRLVDATGQVLAEVADDRVSAQRLLQLDGTGEAAGTESSWREIEVEVVTGDREVLAVLDGRLRERGLQVVPTSSKLAQVLELEPADGATPLTGGSTAGEVLLAHLGEQAEQVRAQDVLVRLDAPDSIHKMRVATRRLRSALTTFKSLVQPDAARPLRDELKWLAAVLGDARDAEVMRERVGRALEEDDQQHARDVDAELEQTYRAAHEQVLAALDGERYHRLLLGLQALLGSPPLTKPAKRPARKALPPLVARSYAAVRELVEEAALETDAAQREELLHDARKTAKRARYAAESVTAVFGKEAKAFAQAMEAVQEALGEHQDSVLTRQRLRELAGTTSSTETAFTYGRLYALEEAREHQTHEHFEAAWTAAQKKSLHRWLR